MINELGIVAYRSTIETLEMRAAELRQNPRVAAEEARLATAADRNGAVVDLSTKLERAEPEVVYDTFVALGARLDWTPKDLQNVSNLALLRRLDTAIHGMRACLSSLVDEPHSTVARSAFDDHAADARSALKAVEPALRDGTARLVAVYRERLFGKAFRGATDVHSAQKLWTLRDETGHALTPFTVVGSEVPHGQVAEAFKTRATDPAAWQEATRVDTMFFNLSFTSWTSRGTLERLSESPSGEKADTWHETAAQHTSALIDAFAAYLPATDLDRVRAAAPYGAVSGKESAADMQVSIFKAANDPKRLAAWMSELVREVGEHAKNHPSPQVNHAFRQGKIAHQAFFEVIERRAQAAGFGDFRFAFDYIEPGEFQGWLADGSLVVDPFYTGELSVGVDAPASNGSRGMYSWPLQFLYMASIDERAPELLRAIGRGTQVPPGSEERQPDTGALKTKGQITQDRIYLSRPGAEYSFLNADVIGLLANTLMPGLTEPMTQDTVPRLS
ncbi:MAG: hypothetical protein AAF654_12370 [Myxococcota bacterium]